MTLKEFTKMYKHTYSRFIQKVYGKHNAVMLAVGMDEILALLDEDMNTIANTQGDEYDEFMICDYLPEVFADRYDADFVTKFHDAAIAYVNRFVNGDVIAHSVAEELILRLAAQIGSDFINDDLEQMPDDINIKKGLEDIDVFETIYHILGDCDVDTFLYDIPEWAFYSSGAYHFSHWFENHFYCHDGSTKADQTENVAETSTC